MAQDLKSLLAEPGVKHENGFQDTEKSLIPAKSPRKTIPRRYKGTIGAIRLNQEKSGPVYRKMTLFRLVKHLVRKEFGRPGLQFSATSVHLIASAMEAIMFRKVALGNLLSLSAGKSSLMPRYALLGMKIQDQPDLRHWVHEDFTQVDLLLEKSQFRNTMLDS